MQQKLWKTSRTKHRRGNHPRLRFTPWAWAKLVYLRDRGPVEIGGFGLTETDDPLLVTDLALVEQICTAASVSFVDWSVAEFFDRQVDRGLRPAQFARIWVHTHPGSCPTPSSTDEATFARVFGPVDWSVMFILAWGGRSYSRLQFRAGPGGALEIPADIDFGQPFAASDEHAWETDYQTKVTIHRSDGLTTTSDRRDGDQQSGTDLSLPTTRTRNVAEVNLTAPCFYPEEYWYDF